MVLDQHEAMSSGIWENVQVQSLCRRRRQRYEVSAKQEEEDKSCIIMKRRARKTSWQPDQ